MMNWEIYSSLGDCDYKENLLTRGDGLISLCQDIPGDAVMYSMIRVMSRPVECPLQGPYRLAYGKGGADKQCSHPPSLMDSCSDNSVIQVNASNLQCRVIYMKFLA